VTVSLSFSKIDVGGKIMSAKWEKLEGNQGVLTIEVDAETVNKGLDEAFKKVVTKVNVPGFRKGKVPRGMFEQRFGVEVLYQDALDIILPEAYAKAVTETGIEPVDQPEIDIENIEKNQPLVFTAKVIVKPEVKLGDYKGLEVERMDANVSDEDVDAVAYAIVNSFTREQCLGLLNELTDEELHQIVAFFVMDKVKAILIDADEDIERDGSGFLH